MPSALHPALRHRWGGYGLSAVFVDSVNGNDDNTGTSAASAFATLARATQELSTGTLQLARGSRFREELTGLSVGVRVRAYGTGDRPVVDGRDPCSEWEQYESIWRTAWAHDFAVDGGKSRHRVWIDGVMAPRAASLAACESTPGSFWADAPTTGGPDWVYVNADPVEHAFELSRRRYCVNLYQQYNQAHITSVETVGNAYADGSLLIDGYAEDCVARDGRVHCAFILGTAVDCQALGIEPGFATMFISYISNNFGGGPAERDVIYRGCVADALGGDASLISAYFVHTNNDGRIFGTVQFEDCHATGCRDGWAGNAARVFLNYRCSYEDVIFAYSYQPVEDVVLLGGEGELTSVNCKLFSQQAPFRTIAHGLKCRSPGGGQGPIFINHADAVVSIDRCTVVAPNGGSIVYQRGDVTLRRSVFTGNNLVSSFVGGAGEPLDAYDADECCYWASNVGNGAFGKAFGGTVFYSSLAAWREYWGGTQDANSIAVDPQIAADFSIGNATVLALGAGAELDEEDDPELQALWASYRIAP